MRISLIQITLFITSSLCFSSGQDNLDLPGTMLASLPFSINECDPEMLGFELITGNVFSAPGNVLDSIPGTLMLTDCLETCQGNELCQSINYETGLCVLFSSTADLLPGKFSVRNIKLSHLLTKSKNIYRSCCDLTCLLSNKTHITCKHFIHCDSIKILNLNIFPLQDTKVIMVEP